MNKIVSEINNTWLALLPYLAFEREDKNRFVEYPVEENKLNISAFMSETILPLFKKEKLENIKEKMQDVLLSFEEMRVKNISLDETKVSEIQKKLSYIVELFKDSNNEILLLAEQNRHIYTFLQDKEKEIDNEAKHILGETLPRFLASSFAREARKLDRTIKNKECFFLLSILAIIVGFLLIDKSQYTYYFPLFLPIVWGLWFLTKSINEDKRLFHEYKHKEVLARTYRIYADQIAKYSDYLLYAERDKIAMYEELAFGFLQKNIDALVNNPAKVLERHSRENPYLTILDKITEMMNKNK